MLRLALRSGPLRGVAPGGRWRAPRPWEQRRFFKSGSAPTDVGPGGTLQESARLQCLPWRVQFRVATRPVRPLRCPLFFSHGLNNLMPRRGDPTRCGAMRCGHEVNATASPVACRFTARAARGTICALAESLAPCLRFGLQPAGELLGEGGPRQTSGRALDRSSIHALDNLLDAIGALGSRRG
jgi:hypothetical protein